MREGYYDRTRREIDYGRIQELEEEMHTIEAQLDLFEAQDIVLLEETQTISTMGERQDKDRQRLEQLKDQRMKLREERAPLVVNLFLLKKWAFEQVKWLLMFLTKP